MKFVLGCVKSNFFRSRVHAISLQCSYCKAVDIVLGWLRLVIPQLWSPLCSPLCSGRSAARPSLWTCSQGRRCLGAGLCFNFHSIYLRPLTSKFLTISFGNKSILSFIFWFKKFRHTTGFRGSDSISFSEKRNVNVHSLYIVEMWNEGETRKPRE